MKNLLLFYLFISTRTLHQQKQSAASTANETQTKTTFPLFTFFFSPWQVEQE
jgi:hypothetical protein